MIVELIVLSCFFFFFYKFLSSESSSLEENFWQKPTLLWFTPKLGLDTETGMEFLCLVGMLLSLLAMSIKSWRDSITFFALWFLYYSLFQVQFEDKFYLTNEYILKGTLNLQEVFFRITGWTNICLFSVVRCYKSVDFIY